MSDDPRPDPADACVDGPEVVVPGVLRRPPPRRRRGVGPLRRGRGAPARPRRARRHRRGRGRRDLPVQPDRLDRPAPGRARASPTRWPPAATDVVAVSPIVAGAALKGPADRLMTELGHEAIGGGVARLYAPCASAPWSSTTPTPRWPTPSRPAGCAASSPRPSCTPRGHARRALARTVLDVRPRAPALARRPAPARRDHAPSARHRRRGARCSPADDLVIPCWPGSARSAGRRPGRPDRRDVELRDGDVVVVTQKIVSKAEGRLVADRPRRPRRPGPG